MRKKICVAIACFVVLLITIVGVSAYGIQLPNVPGGILYWNANIGSSGPSTQNGYIVVYGDNDYVGEAPPEFTFYFFNYPSEVAKYTNTDPLAVRIRVRVQEDQSNVRMITLSDAVCQRGWINENTYFVRFSPTINVNAYNVVLGAANYEFALHVDTDYVADEGQYDDAYVTINDPYGEGDAPVIPDTPPWGDEEDPQNIYDLGYNLGYDTGYTVGNNYGYQNGYSVGYAEGKNSSLSNGAFAGVGDFLTSTIGGFLSFEIMPNISLGGILAAVVGLYALFAFLRYYSGG